jgi:5-methyltetrahydrofolate--homocysteine methyltransferase
MTASGRDLGALTAAVERGDLEGATALTQQAIDEGADAGRVLTALTSAMDRIGEQFQSSQIFVPEMLVAARAMKAAMSLLEPLLVDAGIRPEHTAVIGTIRGDLHDIGKNLVGMMWKGANINVIDLGTNVSPTRFVDAVREHDARIVGISALLTTTMVGMRAAVEAVHDAYAGGRVSVVVGGAPVTAEFAAQIGADAYAPDAGAAVDVVRGLLAR